MNSNNPDGFRVWPLHTGVGLLIAGFCISNLLLATRVNASEAKEDGVRVTFGLVSVVVPHDCEIVITSKPPDASIGHLQRDDGLRIDFALGLVGPNELDAPPAGTVAWTLSGEGRLGQVSARLLIETDGKMRFDGSTEMAKFASRFENEEDVGTLLLILRSVGPPCPTCIRPSNHSPSH